MERVGTLINKLKEQFEQHADAEKLSVTARLLLSELQCNQHATVSKGKISVTLPAFVAADMPMSRQPVAPPQPVADQPAVSVAVAEKEPNGWLFNTPEEIPTLAHQEEKEIFELNELMVSENGSLNEKLKEDRVEIAAVLQGTPIRDLKKAIGVNDRYQFVNDLFRGDENMYERSMKTINGFSIYPEAQYWIQRELKVKMGWKEDSDTVKLFDQLIKRRFS